MCGRFALIEGSWEEYHEMLSIVPAAPNTPSYNIKPTQDIDIVIDHGEFISAKARWWLVPTWYRGEIKDWKATTFNARIEEAAEKPSFRGSWQYTRCLIPASGYFEYTGERGNKQPWYIRPLSNRRTFFMAGLYTEWNNVRTASILTRSAQDDISAIHHRMPVIMDEDQAIEWLQSPDRALSYGLSFSMEAYKVNKIGTHDEGPSVIDPYKGE